VQEATQTHAAERRNLAPDPLPLHLQLQFHFALLSKLLHCGCDLLVIAVVHQEQR
jgi:hypothetical protein